MGYMESIFTRAEHQFRTLDEQIGWLSTFKDKPGNAYEKDAVRVAETLQRGIEISEQAKSSNSLSELKELLSEAKKLKFNKDTPLEIIDDRIISIEEVLEKERLEVEKQEREIAERIAKEEEKTQREIEQERAKRETLAEEYKEAETIEEREKVAAELREVEGGGRVLGGLRSGEVRRAPRAFRSVFGEI